MNRPQKQNIQLNAENLCNSILSYDFDDKITTLIGNDSLLCFKDEEQYDELMMDIATRLSKNFQADTVIEVMDALDTTLKNCKNFIAELAKSSHQ